MVTIEALTECNSTESERSPQLLQYLAGIFDVSGSITINHHPATAKKRESFALQFYFDRKNPALVGLMNQVFPMQRDLMITPSPNEKKRNRWSVTGKKAEDVIEELRPYLILKFGHLQVVDDFLVLKVARTTQESEEFKRKIAELNKSPIIKEGDGILSDEYVAGVFDAHGSILLNTKPHRAGLTLNVTVNNQSFIEQLGRYFETKPIPRKNKDGTIRSYAVSLSANKALEKLKQIYPYLKLLQPLADLGIEFQNLRNSGGEYQGRKLREEEIAAQVRIIHEQNRRK